MQTGPSGIGRQRTTLANVEEPLDRIYDDFAATYALNRTVFNIDEEMRDFLEVLPSAGALLDLGCGAGEPVAAQFVDLGWTATGVDFSHGMLELAAHYVPEMTRICSDMRDVQFPEASFDAVTCVYALFHVPRAHHPELFRRVHGWLRPGGGFLFTYATAAYTGSPRFEGMKEFMGRRLFYSHETPARMEEQLTAAGLHLVSARNRDIGGETFLWVIARRSADTQD